ncbi:MAG: hypothetical protein OQK24_06735 [Magnetovibrio sp.]|nr:hypothetical protein [Magnetovibrio sp.]
MASIDTQASAQAYTARDAFNQAAGRSAASVSVTDNADQSTSKDDPSSAQGRVVNDTVTLSEGGSKVVNLARGESLAEDLRNAPVDEDYAQKLEQATDDVFRISELFNKTVRAAFNLWR